MAKHSHKILTLKIAILFSSFFFKTANFFVNIQFKVNCYSTLKKKLFQFKYHKKTNSMASKNCAGILFFH